MLSKNDKKILLNKVNELKLAKFNVGKGGLTDNVIETLNNYLNKYEIIKISLLNNSFTDKDEKNELILNIIDSLKAEVVDIRGGTIILYKRNNKNKTHLL